MIDNQIEYILCAAIWYKELKLVKKLEVNPNPDNIDCGLVFCGHRHPHCIWTMISITGKRGVEPECGKYTQGFLTSKNRFVDRIEGAKIAKQANQIGSGITVLYSEDLY